jgi:hypothetical protein
MLRKFMYSAAFVAGSLAFVVTAAAPKLWA